MQSGMRTCANGMPAYVALPKLEGAEKRPVIILMHERYGLVRHTMDLAERHAREGLVCIAPDFFFRHPDQDALHRGDVGYPMTDPESVELLSAAVQEAASITCADTSRLFVMGVCQTGRHPLVYAAGHDIAAALVWYGAAHEKEWKVNDQFPVGLHDLIQKVKCPVLGLFGEGDHVISLDDVRRLRNSLEDAKLSYQIQVAPGAPHGWLNDTMPGRYRREQAEAAWATQRAFIADVLAGKFARTIVQKCEIEFSPSYDFTKNQRYE